MSHNEDEVNLWEHERNGDCDAESEKEFQAECEDMATNIEEGVIKKQWDVGQAKEAMSHSDCKDKVAAMVHEFLRWSICWRP